MPEVPWIALILSFDTIIQLASRSDKRTVSEPSPKLLFRRLQKNGQSGISTKFCLKAKRFKLQTALVRESSGRIILSKTILNLSLKPSIPYNLSKFAKFKRFLRFAVRSITD